MWQIFFQSTPWGRLTRSLLVRVTAASPRLLTSSRVSSPQCGAGLYQSCLEKQRDPRAQCWIFAEPAAFQLLHVPRWCKRCVTAPSEAAASDAAPQMARTTRHWCGFLEEPVPGRQRTYQKRVDTGYMHQDFFLTRNSFGVAVSWLRRWRYQLLLHRASFQGEAELFRTMHGPHLLKRARVCLSDAWERHIIWKRALRRIICQPQRAQGAFADRDSGGAHCKLMARLLGAPRLL